jgi:hypothetical protein
VLKYIDGRFLKLGQAKDSEYDMSPTAIYPRYDADGDGELSEAELVASTELNMRTNGYEDVNPGASITRIKQAHADHDRDSSGGLSEEEWGRFVAQLSADQFEILVPYDAHPGLEGAPFLAE